MLLTMQSMKYERILDGESVTGSATDVAKALINQHPKINMITSSWVGLQKGIIEAHLELSVHAGWTTISRS